MNAQTVDFIEGVTTLVCVLFAIASVGSFFYVRRVYSMRKEEAPFLTRLVRRDQRVAIAGAIILIYLALALSDRGLGRPWGAIIIGGAFCLCLYGVFDDAVTWYRERRRYGK